MGLLQGEYPSIVQRRMLLTAKDLKGDPDCWGIRKEVLGCLAGIWRARERSFTNGSSIHIISFAPAADVYLIVRVFGAWYPREGEAFSSSEPVMTVHDNICRALYPDRICPEATIGNRTYDLGYALWNNFF
ncbi:MULTISPECIES: hypothetical protein [unclassified Bradyrhizobium]|uniref:hypothetical protein n=1 Tax=unclassified Bradyrhizobium TaxID=2631580 RepID=UPI0029160A33|nr:MULTISPECIES: hypothetical protein [unclassified Bradyrhizobium]